MGKVAEAPASALSKVCSCCGEAYQQNVGREDGRAKSAHLHFRSGERPATRGRAGAALEIANSPEHRPPFWIRSVREKLKGNAKRKWTVEWDRSCCWEDGKDSKGKAQDDCGTF